MIEKAVQENCSCKNINEFSQRLIFEKRWLNLKSNNFVTKKYIQLVSSHLITMLFSKYWIFYYIEYNIKMLCSVYIVIFKSSLYKLSLYIKQQMWLR